MTAAERDGIPCLWMRGGTSKGAIFLRDHLPADDDSRDDVLRRIMGSPDADQIDGIGGGHPLTSKVAILSRSNEPDVDVDYLFVQVTPDTGAISTSQTCGNILAAVGPAAIERGLVEAKDPETTVTIRLLNTGAKTTSTFLTPHATVEYAGPARIDGVPGTALAIELTSDTDRALFPTGEVIETIEGLRVTLVDNGMPVVVLDATDFGLTGREAVEQLEADGDLAEGLRRVRLEAGSRMGLGDVAETTVPKMILVAAPRGDEALQTRAFIPTRVHRSLGVLMAASIAAATRVPGTVAHAIGHDAPADRPVRLGHPSGTIDSAATVYHDDTGTWRATSSSVRTTRRLFDGRVFPRPAATVQPGDPELSTPRPR